MKSCCVPGCENRTARRHTIPRNADVRNIWIDRIGNPKLRGLEAHLLKHYFVCHTHFEPICLAANGRLLKNALPTLNLPGFTLPSSKETCFLKIQYPFVVKTPEKVRSILKSRYLSAITQNDSQEEARKGLFQQSQSEQLNLHFGIDATVPESSGSYEQQLSGSDIKEETYETEDVELSDTSFPSYTTCPPRPNVEFFPLFSIGSSKSYEPLNLRFGINATSPESSGSSMVTASQKKRQDPPSSASHTRKRLVSEVSMCELQQLSESVTKEVTFGTQDVELTDTSVPDASHIKCVSLSSLVSTPLHSNSPKNH